MFESKYYWFWMICSDTKIDKIKIRKSKLIVANLLVFCYDEKVDNQKKG